MALLPQRIRYGAILVLVLALFGAAFGAASAALARPNQLDRRVDAMASSALLAQPAAALVDSDRQAAAVRLAHLRLPGFLLTALLEAAALIYFWRSGAAAALRDRLRASLRAPWQTRFVFGAALALVARTAALLPAFYLYRVERVMDLTVDLTRTWAAFWLLHTIVAMVVAGIVAAFVLWLVDRTHQWYLYAIVVILGISIAWSYSSPYFDLPSSSGAVPVAGALRGQISAALDRGHIPAMPVYIEGAGSSPATGAAVLGLGRFHRVVVARPLAGASTVPEVVFRVMDAIGHALHADPLYVALIEGGIIIVFSAIAVVAADRIGFRRDDDPLSRLALVGALLALVYLAAVPVRNAALRSYDFDADRFALSLTGDRAAAVRTLVREADQRMEEVCPGLLSRLFLDAHPAPGERIAAINGVPDGCP